MSSSSDITWRQSLRSISASGDETMTGGVVVQDINASEVGCCLLDPPLSRTRIRQIHRVAKHVVTLMTERRSTAFCCALLKVAPDDSSALACIELLCSPPLATAGSSNEYPLTIETHRYPSDGELDSASYPYSFEVDGPRRLPVKPLVPRP